MPTILLILLGLPLAAAVGVAILGALASPGADATGLARRNAGVRWLALASTLACLALALVVAVQYAVEVVPERTAEELDSAIFAPAYSTAWDVLPLGSPAGGKAPAIQFYVGVDGLNLWLVVLTCLLLVPSVLVSWKSIEDRVPEFYAWLRVL